MTTALIVTGQLRSFEKTIDQLDKCIITPNNTILFILCATNDEEQLKNLIEKKKIKLGGIITAESFKNDEYDQIFKMIKNSNRPGLTEEVFSKSRKADNLNWTFDYLENGGSILQYYQFWKIWFKVLEYEKINNMKFIYCIRCRTDGLFGKQINIKDFYTPTTFESLYIKNNYDNNCGGKYSDKVIYDIDHDNTVITCAVEFVWFGKRCVFDRLSQIIFHYGLWDSGDPFSFNSETTFHEFCKHYNIYHISLTDKDWLMNVYTLEDGLNYTFSILR